jgi:integrase/recombinase XerD
MATAAVMLKTTKKLLNNEYAVAIRVTHERQSRYYPLSALVTNQSLSWRCTIED